MSQNIFSITMQDGSVFNLPQEWEEVFVSNVDKEDYHEFKERVKFLVKKYYDHRSIPTKFDGLIPIKETGDDKYDNQDFYGETWEEHNRGTLGTPIPIPPSFALLAERLIYQNFRGELLQSALIKSGSKMKVVTPCEFLEVTPID